MDDKVITLSQPKGKRRNIEGDRFLNICHIKECHHPGFLVDDSKQVVECATCKKELNPMWVLVKLAAKESTWYQAHDRYQDEMKRLEERSKTTCEHCKKMTRISRN